MGGGIIGAKAHRIARVLETILSSLIEARIAAAGMNGRALDGAIRVDQNVQHRSAIEGVVPRRAQALEAMALHFIAGHLAPSGFERFDPAVWPSGFSGGVNVGRDSRRGARGQQARQRNQGKAIWIHGVG